MRSELIESWQPIANTLGFRTEEEMLKHLYVQQGFSLNELSKILGPSFWAIRRRLVLLGVPMRRRGGARQRLGRRRLKDVTMEELERKSPTELAAKYGVHVSTVFAEKRLRKGELDGLLSNSTDQVPESLGDIEQHTYGAGPVVDEE